MDIVPILPTREHIEQTINVRFGFTGKEQQIEALCALLIDIIDVILVAGTGFGKSIVFQAAPLVFSTPRIVLVLSPLNALMDEQCKKLSQKQGCKPFVLNGESHSIANVQHVQDGCFTHGIYILLLHS